MFPFELVRLVPFGPLHQYLTKVKVGAAIVD